ncbi:peroxidase 57-like [Silene latifolia]|uniref:peroxidase 57-like n=1 Tax=Silene latifolia TaxID=37657 RepID=UPI003D78AB41
MKFSSSSSVFALGIILMTLVSQSYGNLKVGYYRGKCGKHNVEEIVFNVVKAYASKDPNTVGHLIRLQFHDCIVRGCDASVLVDGPKTEKTAKPNLSLGGFEVIDTAKDVLESVCPGVVSCSDILILAARSSVALYGGKWYDAETGRRDGWVSSQSEALKNLPSVNMPVQNAVHLFNSRGLTKEDFVVLLGGHTVGKVHCDKFQDRLYNFYNTRKPDPRMNPALLKTLRNTCPAKGKINSATFLDQTPKSYYRMDNGYYKQLVANRGVLEIDVNIANSPLTNSIVKKLAYSNDGFFLDKFGKAMIKMGRIGVLTGKQGEIRRSCGAINRH